MHKKKFIKVNNEKITYFEYKTGKNLLKRIVLFCHGFPGSHNFNAMAKPLNNHGIILEMIKYRGDKESDGTFSLFGSIEDIKSVTQQLKRQYPNLPITVLGYSMGGFYTCNIIREQPELFDKIVLLNPLLDTSFFQTPLMKELWILAKDLLRLNEMDFYEAETDKIMKDYNPITFADQLKQGINIVQSENDEVLPPETTQKFYKKLPNPGEFIWVPDADHSLSGHEPELINFLIK